MATTTTDVERTLAHVVASAFDTALSIADHTLTDTQRAAMFRTWAVAELIEHSATDVDEDDRGETAAIALVVKALADHKCLHGARLVIPGPHLAHIHVWLPMHAGERIPTTTVAVDLNTGTATWLGWPVFETEHVCTITLGAEHLADVVARSIRG